MLKNKTLQTVVTFPNTASALEMEQACHAANIPGRIIPVPNQITAGCGFAWRAEAENRDLIETFILEKGLKHDRIYTIEI